MNDEILHFDSIDEFELFLTGFIAMLNDMNNREFFIDDVIRNVDEERVDIFIPFSFDTVNSTHSWYANVPYETQGVFLWKHISYAITRSNWIITNAAVNSSWTTGFTVYGWTHRQGNADWIMQTSGTYTVTLSAMGTWLFGISVGGFPIGFSFDETWVVHLSGL